MSTRQNQIRSRETRTKRKRKERSEHYKKFIGNKQEGQGFADKRKRKIQQEYRKLLKKELLRNQPGIPATNCVDIEAESSTNSERDNKESKTSNKLTGFSKLQSDSQRRKAESILRKKEIGHQVAERLMARQNYKEKKKGREKRLCRKTQKGKPVMKNQIEYLLNKIQKDKS